MTELKSLLESTSTGTMIMNLLILNKKGFLIPETHILTGPALTEFSRNNSKLPDELESKLNQIIDPKRIYSIFPSNEGIDKAELRDSVLRNQARGLKAVEQRIEELWQKDQRIQLGKNWSSVSSNDNSLVIMQIPQIRLSGFVFTRNPLNGLNETILELVSHPPVSEEVQFQQLIFRNGRRENDKDECHLCDSETLEKIVEESASIERVFGKPVFLEWVYDGEKIFWLLVKPLHSLEGLNVYSNKIAKDMLPGIILPLVWSVNTPLVNSSWKRLITQLIGKNSIDIKKMTKQFYHRAYFNMGIFGDFFNLFGMPRETLEIMMLGEAHRGERPKMKMDMKVLRYLPRIGFFALKNVMIARKINRFLQAQKLIIDSYNRDISSLNEEETMKAVNEIIKLNEQCSYNVIVVRLVRSFHHMILRSSLSKRGLDTKIEFNTEDLADIEPKYSLFLLKEKYDALPQQLKDDLENGKITPQITDYRGFAEEYERFVMRFGHLSDSTTDLSKPQWRENSQLIMNLIRDSQQTPEKNLQVNPKFPGALSGLMLQTFYKSFVDYEKYSLRLSFLYTYGYSLFRSYFLHLGQVFKSKGYISESTDIFYLTIDEIKRIVDSGRFESNNLSAIKKRKDEIAEYADIILPEVIFGDIPPPPVRKDAIIMRLKGLPSSKGYYEGLAKVAKSIADFNKITQGDVLVIPYSDVSWTPLFRKAGAVVSESGGLLSHCSIVAREYGIPAVVAVKGATRIEDNTKIIVDGYTGEVLIKALKQARSATL